MWSPNILKVWFVRIGPIRLAWRVKFCYSVSAIERVYIQLSIHDQFLFIRWSIINEEALWFVSSCCNCDNSGLLDVTELSNGNWQGKSPNMCLTQNVGIFWVVVECNYQWRILSAKFLFALQLLLFQSVDKVQKWTLWVRVTTNNQLNILFSLLELVAADCV